MKKGDRDKNVLVVQEWFAKTVTYDGEPYTIDYEQAAAIADASFNTIVVARAGSGKTRTLVAKIVYLIMQCKVRPDQIMAFVFNANAAKEINERLTRIRVNGKKVVRDGIYDNKVAREGACNDDKENRNGNNNQLAIANTFHAFARKIVYGASGGEKKCGKILAGEKSLFILEIVKRMISGTNWCQKIVWFIKGEDAMGQVGGSWKVIDDGPIINDDELKRFSVMMLQFVNRAQQKYLGGEVTVGEVARDYLSRNDVSPRERLFIEIGTEVFRRYHWYLLDQKRGLDGFTEFGTDFNLIVSWASKLITSGRPEAVELLKDKKYILIDEYQDFSQLFLAAVEAIRSVATDARLFVVGDDWQAINRFAGSDVEHFKQFEQYFGKARSANCSNVLPYAKYEITTNYRCDSEIVETARRFMLKSMKEKGNFRAFSRKYGRVTVVNPRETEVGYALVPYDARVSGEDVIIREAANWTGCRVAKKSMVRYLKTVIDVIRANLKAREILILHRNNEMNVGSIGLEELGKGLKWGLNRLGVMSTDEFDEKVKLMTMHKSKGLEAEVVIILEADEGVIPKSHPDTLLYGMFGETEEVALDDQKRLFYVAMTRAKRRLYIIHDGSSGVGFVKYFKKRVNKWDE